MDESSEATRRTWLWIALIAVLANPLTLIGACSASLGMANPGSLGDTVVYEKWTYRLRHPERGDAIASHHPQLGVSLVGSVDSRTADGLIVRGQYMRPGASVPSTESVTVTESEVDGKVIGSLSGTGDEDLAAICLFVAPWIVGFVMLWGAVARTESMRNRVDGSNWWLPFPLFLWGLGTAIYAWRVRNLPKQESNGP